MAALIDSLIDKVDNFERIVLAVGGLLTVEEAKQRELAQAAQKDPADWSFRVYTERSNPFEEFLSHDEEKETGVALDTSPIVNVWFDSDATELARSNLIETQSHSGVFNIDVYGYGKSRGSAGDYEPGDALAAAAAKRAARLVRNIVMSAHYYDLGLPGVVSRRWIQSRQAWQPQTDQNALQRIIAMRLALHVDFIEQSPQVTGPLLEEISVGVRRRSDGLLYLTATFLPTE